MKRSHHAPLTFLFICFVWGSFQAFGQCQNNVDFNTWIQEGVPSNGNWNVQGGGVSVNQTINGDPTLYISPDTFINVLINGIFQINDNFDDDYVGFVFGYKNPTGNSTQYDTYLFSWKRGTQTKFTSTGMQQTAQEGMTLAKVTGNIGTPNQLLTNFWGQTNSAQYQVLATNYSPTAGWNSFTPIAFSLLYTSTRITIAIDGAIVFDVPGCYERGRFGFYNYSQPDVNYSNFSYRLFSNFEPTSYQFCQGVGLGLNFTDSTCAGSASATQNIASWAWDFGDGSGSILTNPVHVYSTPGPYDVKLVITDINGCKDSVTKTITVIPPPDVDLGPDIDKCPNDIVTLNGTIPGGASYSWFPPTNLSPPNSSTPNTNTPVSMTYAITATDTAGCKDIDTINVNVFPFVPAVAGLDVDCFGANTGIGAAGIAGLAPYTFTWQNSNGNNVRQTVNSSIGVDTASNLSPGIYTVTISDGNGCDTTLSITINQPAMPLATIISSQTNILCNSASTGSFSVTSSGGTPGYTYSFNGGAFSSTSTFNNLAAGIYTVTIRDANGCLETIQATLTEPQPLLSSIDAQKNVTCNGDNTGWVRILGAGGAGGYTYSLNGSPFSANNTFPNLSAGNSLITTQDANGCLVLINVSITEPQALSGIVTGQVNINCVGDNTGSFSIMGNGGNPGYMYALDGINFQASSTFTNLPAGPFTVTIQDDSACVATFAGATLTEPIALAVTNIFQQNVDCNGNSSGGVTLQGIGGNPGYSFSIDGVNFSPATTIGGLAVGSYTVTVRDDSLCTATLPVTITEPPVLSVSITSQTQVDCNGNNTGSVTVAGAGGTAPYQYAIDGVTFNSSDTFNGLAAGNYTITVQDDSLCQATIPVVVTEPTPLTAVFVNKTDVDCFGNANGSLTIGGMGGTPPYMYALAGITNYQMSPTFLQLAPTTFQVVVRDAQLCTDTISVMVTTPTGLTVNIDSVIHIGCNGDSSGKIGLTPSGATAPYSFSLDGVNYNPIQLMTGLAAGSYFIRVQDGQSCIAAFNIDIDEPPLLTGFVRSTLDVGCNGTSTGAATIGVTGGQLNYLFSIDGVNFGTDSTFTGLTAGNYQVVILDDSSCVDTVFFSLTEPTQLVSAIDSLQNISCYAAQNGFVSVATSGGTLPYQFSFDGGPFGTDTAWSNLGPGNYVITVMDDNACTVLVPVTILEPDTLTLSNGEQINVNCNGNTTGQVTVQAVGGTVPYQYSIDGGAFGPTPVFSGLAAGTYTITVMDDSSCTATLLVTITEPPVMGITLASQNNIDCFGNNTGSFTVSAMGGTTPYRYSIDGINFVPNPAFTDLVAGTYTVTLEDDSSCTATLSITLTEPDLLEVSAVGTDVLCFEGMDGMVSAIVQGGTVPYAYLWDTNPPRTTAAIDSLVKGTYSVSIIDANGCEASDAASIDHPPLLEVSLVEYVDPFCNWPNGSIEVTVTGGISSVYTYAWNTAPVLREAAISNLFEGTYYVVVRDENDCFDTLSVKLTNTPPAIPFFLTEPSYENPILESDAQILFLNQSQGAIAYDWDFGDQMGRSADENPTYTYLEPGQYPVTLTAYNRYLVCPTDTTFILNIIPDGALYFANAFSPNGDNVNDIFYFKGEGIVAVDAHIYNRWGQEMAVITNVEDGWDGTYQGKAVPEGVYMYVVKAEFNNGTVVERGGSITVIR